MMARGRILAITLLAIAIITMVIRARLVDLPFERDEGEYAYAGQLLLQGIPPFADAYNMKMPGIYGAYAAIMAVAGQSHRAIHAALIVINLLTTALLFLAFRRLFDRDTAAAAAAAFLLLSITPASLGITANAEHFVLLFAAAALFVLVRAIDAENSVLIFVAGLLFGLAFLMKQHGAFLVVFGVVLLALSTRQRFGGGWRRRSGALGMFALGVVIPFGFLCIAMWAAGVFDRFWFWTFEYGRTYVSQAPIGVGFRVLVSRMGDLIMDSPMLWIFAIVGVLSPLFRRSSIPKGKAGPAVLYSFVLLSFLATVPGFFFRPHYFILVLPAIALLAGLGFVSVARYSPIRFREAFLAGLVLATTAVHVKAESRVYLSLTPTQVSRHIYGNNPFPESLAVAGHIERNSGPDDTIAVLGSEPQIYFYAKRRAATGYMYTYALMERHDFAVEMQKEMMAQVEQARPKFVVLVGVPTSWLVRPDSQRLIFEWAKGYLGEHYRKVRDFPSGAENPSMELWERNS